MVGQIQVPIFDQVFGDRLKSRLGAPHNTSNPVPNDQKSTFDLQILLPRLQPCVPDAHCQAWNTVCAVDKRTQGCETIGENKCLK